MSFPVVSNSHRFVYQDPENPTILVLDGTNANQDQKTTIEDNEIVQLKTAFPDEKTLELEGFDLDRRINEIAINDVMIVDEVDVVWLIRLIYRKIKIVFSTHTLSVSPLASDHLAKRLTELPPLVKVIAGSTITIAREQGYSGCDRSERVLYACERIGFKVLFF